MGIGPLFEWNPAQPQCAVVPFPLDRRTGKVRRTAEILISKHGQAATSYWRQVVTGLDSQMDRARLPADVREAELRRFWDAVKAEIERQSSRGRRPGGDAA